ncbi:hypothetical protein JCM8115_004619 [Rhodotorula mucilaginosa]
MLGSRGLRVGSPAFLPLTLQALSAQRGLSQSTRRALPLPTKIVKGPVHDRRVQLLAHRVPAEREIDLKQIMDDLRDLELLDVLNKVSPKSGSGYKDATRALYPLFYQSQARDGKCTFGELQKALPPLYGLAWLAISDRLLSGSITRLQELSETDKAALRFLQIYNIGPARALDFAYAGCRTFDDLLEWPEDQKPKLAHAHKVGLKHRQDINRLIPREEMDALKEALQEAVYAANFDFECEILGSYRRGVPFSSDVDLAIWHKSFDGSKEHDALGKELLESVVQKLEERGLVEKENELARGVKKYAGLVRLPGNPHYGRIDVRLAPYFSYPYMLLGSTGDSLLMKLLRFTAKQKGWCLNEYGMGDKYNAADQNPNGFRPNTFKVVTSEREIFELLELPYLSPTERNFRTWGPKYLREVRDFVAKL